MARRTTRPELAPDPRAGSDRILAALRLGAEADLRELADLLATKDDTNTFGATEFTVRDIVLRAGAKAVAVALAGRKKGGTMGPAAPAPAAPGRPSSGGGSPGPS